MPAGVRLDVIADDGDQCRIRRDDTDSYSVSVGESGTAVYLDTAGLVRLRDGINHLLQFDRGN